MKSKVYVSRAVRYVSAALMLLLYLGNTHLSRGLTDNSPDKPGNGGFASAKKEKPVLVKTGVDRRRNSGQGNSKAQLGKPVTKSTNDPIRFTIVTSKAEVATHEPIELTIRAERLDIPSSLMFFTEDASAFRLKVLPPPGFITTGGTYRDLVGDKLTPGGRTEVSYTLQGYFESTSPTMCFRLLRGGGQADDNSLFVEKANLCVREKKQVSFARLGTGTGSPVPTPMQVSTGDCSGITLSASASPTTLNPGGNATLAATCAGCGSGSSFNSGQALVFDGVDDQVEMGGVYSPIGSTFTWEAWINPVQPLTGDKYNEHYALFPAWGGNNGTVTGMGIAVGTNGIRVCEHTVDYLNVQLAHDQSISGWTHIAVVYTNNIPSLYINGQFIKNGVASGKTPRPSMNVGGGNYGHFQGSIDEARMWNVARTQAQIASTYQQIISNSETGLVGYWRFEDTGNTTTSSVTSGPQPISGTLENGTSRGAGVSSGNAGGGATYSWQALQGGSTIANPTAASTPVTVPTTVGSYAYRVTLNSGSCQTTQDVTLTVANSTPSGIVAGNCYTIQNQSSQGYAQRQSDNYVKMVNRNTADDNQLWKAQAVGSRFYFVSQGGSNSDQVLYVDNTNCGAEVKVGNYANDDYHNWTLEQNTGNVYRVQTQGKTWDQRSAGQDPILQMCGDNNASDNYYNQPFRLFAFAETTCPNGSNLTVNPTALNQQSASGGTQTISVTSNVSWSASSPDNWLTVSPANGSNNSTFTITIQANGGAARPGTVNVSGGGITRSIAISQLAAGAGANVLSGNCYVIKSLQTTSANNTLQPSADNIVRHQVANGQDSQTWKAESVGSQFRFIGQSGNRDQVLYVNGFGDGQPLRVGNYTNDERERWTLAASSVGGYRVYGGSSQNTWDQAGAGSGPELQLYGSESVHDEHWNQGYRRFSFTQTTCPTTCNAPTLSLQTPVCNGTSTYTVPFTVQTGATVTSSAGSVSGNQIINVPAGSGLTVTATLNNCQSQASVTSPVCSSPTSGFVKHDLTGTRWWGLSTYFFNPNSDGSFSAVDDRMIAASAAHHANFVFVNIDWARCEQSDGSWNFNYLDKAGARALQLGLKLFIRFNVSVSLDANYSYYIPQSEAAYDEHGDISDIGHARILSLDSDISKTRINAFITAMLQHASTKSYVGQILGVSVTHDSGYEGEYNQDNSTASAGQQRSLFDYSDRSLAKFVERMKVKYHNDINAANAAWNTPFGQWTDVRLPIVPRAYSTSIFWAFNSNQLTVDFYNHRQESLAAFINGWQDAVKAVSPNLATLAEFGSMWDNRSYGRGTMTLQSKPLRVDGCKNNNQPGDDGFYLASAIALRDRSAEKWAGDEVENVTVNSLQTQLTWAVTAYQSGCTLVDYANYRIAGGDTEAQYQYAEDRIAQLGDAIHAQTPIGPISTAKPAVDETMTINASTLLQRSWIDGGPGGPLKQQYIDKTVNRTKVIAVKIIDDL